MWTEILGRERELYAGELALWRSIPQRIPCLSNRDVVDLDPLRSAGGAKSDHPFHDHIHTQEALQVI